MGEISHFIAMPFDRIADGLVAGEPFKCATPVSAIEHAKGYWKIFGHAGAIAFVRTGPLPATLPLQGSTKSRTPSHRACDPKPISRPAAGMSAFGVKAAQ